MTLWADLGTSMRRLRSSAGLSLRVVEEKSGVGRGTLSQVERGRARPSRALVEWYDDNLAGDGLLLSLYAEARGAYRTSTGHAREPAPADGDDLEVSAALVPEGALVATSAHLTLGWTVTNRGPHLWAGRSLCRVGAHEGVGLLRSARCVPLPDVAVGESVEVSVDVVAPDSPGTVVGYWELIDAAGRACFPVEASIRQTLVVR